MPKQRSSIGPMLLRVCVVAALGLAIVFLLSEQNSVRYTMPDKTAFQTFGLNMLARTVRDGADEKDDSVEFVNECPAGKEDKEIWCCEGPKTGFAPAKHLEETFEEAWSEYNDPPDSSPVADIDGEEYWEGIIYIVEALLVRFKNDVCEAAGGTLDGGECTGASKDQDEYVKDFLIKNYWDQYDGKSIDDLDKEMPGNGLGLVDDAVWKDFFKKFKRQMDANKKTFTIKYKEGGEEKEKEVNSAYLPCGKKEACNNCEGISLSTPSNYNSSTPPTSNPSSGGQESSGKGGKKSRVNRIGKDDKSSDGKESSESSGSSENSSSSYHPHSSSQSSSNSSAYCGDGVMQIENAEFCDGDDFGSETCESQTGLPSNGYLDCTDDCVIDTSFCAASSAPTSTSSYYSSSYSSSSSDSSSYSSDSSSYSSDSSSYSSSVSSEENDDNLVFFMNTEAKDRWCCDAVVDAKWKENDVCGKTEPDSCTVKTDIGKLKELLSPNEDSCKDRCPDCYSYEGYVWLDKESAESKGYSVEDGVLHLCVPDPKSVSIHAPVQPIRYTNNNQFLATFALSDWIQTSFFLNLSIISHSRVYAQPPLRGPVPGPAGAPAAGGPAAAGGISIPGKAVLKNECLSATYWSSKVSTAKFFRKNIVQCACVNPDFKVLDKAGGTVQLFNPVVKFSDGNDYPKQHQQCNLCSKIATNAPNVVSRIQTKIKSMSTTDPNAHFWVMDYSNANGPFGCNCSKALNDVGYYPVDETLITQDIEKITGGRNDIDVEYQQCVYCEENAVIGKSDGAVDGVDLDPEDVRLGQKYHVVENGGKCSCAQRYQLRKDASGLAKTKSITIKKDGTGPEEDVDILDCFRVSCPKTHDQKPVQTIPDGHLNKPADFKDSKDYACLCRTIADGGKELTKDDNGIYTQDNCPKPEREEDPDPDPGPGGPGQGPGGPGGAPGGMPGMFGMGPLVGPGGDEGNGPGGVGPGGVGPGGAAGAAAGAGPGGAAGAAAGGESGGDTGGPVDPICGDGVLDEGEECDDGNTADDDGCSSVCLEEFCGDEVVQIDEECDDGNTIPGDGCDQFCVNEVPPECGDGILQEFESCDNGEFNSDTNPDACRTDCTLPRCGDDVIDTSESCDNGIDNDDFEPGACRTNCSICGDGFLDGFEAPEIFTPTSDAFIDPASAGNEGVFPFLGQLIGPPQVIEPICGNGICESGEADVPNACDRQGITDPRCDGGPDLIGSCPEDCLEGDTGFSGDATTGGGFGGSGGEVGTVSTFIPLEECDDGGFNSDSEPNTCRSSCTLPVCGDGVVDDLFGEQCDDGNTEPGDGCDDFCINELCGDGKLDVGEQCDDSNNAGQDGCSPNCQIEYCGDGQVQGELPALTLGGTVLIDAPEHCDNGSICSQDPGLSCTFNEDCFVCLQVTDDLSRCGGDPNGPICETTEDCLQLDLPFVCEYDGRNGDCNELCQSTVGACGNGFEEGEEECDDGNNLGGDGCSASCRLEFCGDGVITNGIVLKETCDNGSVCSHDPGLSCLSNLDCRRCQPVEGSTLRRCGGDPRGAICDTDEACFEFAPYFCRYHQERDPDCIAGLCITFECGNGIKEEGEECDLGENNSDTEPNVCRTDCSFPRCGDGTLDSIEQCDDGNTEPGDGCSPICISELCGNGDIDFGEQCDDGNNTAQDGCSPVCREEFCGDGVVQEQLNEQCDLGGVCNHNPEKSCTNSAECRLCETIPGTDVSRCGGDSGAPICQTDADCANRVPFECVLRESVLENSECTRCRLADPGLCGNGIEEGLEQCDDGNSLSGDGCSASCRFEFCGDGLVQPERAITSITGAGLVDAPEQCDNGSICTQNPSLSCVSPLDCRRCTNIPGTNASRCGGDPLGILCENDEQCFAQNQYNCVYNRQVDTSCIRCQSGLCGNGIKEVLEECDDGNALSGDGCSRQCTKEFCGDGIFQESYPVVSPSGSRLEGRSEQCDNGSVCSQNPDMICRNHEDCNICLPVPNDSDVIANVQNRCGGDPNGKPCEDNIDCARGPFTCNYDQAVNPDCDFACQLTSNPLCGDGELQEEEGEVCDDGNRNPDDGCSPNCRELTDPVCGDGIRTLPVEQCDDGNDRDDDGCTTQCRLIVPPNCGDGVFQPQEGEQCDDGNANPDDGCDTFCRLDPERLRCGDGITTLPIEECDDRNAQDGDGCSARCRLERPSTSGNTSGNVSGNVSGNIGGTIGDQPFPRCGDAILIQGEQCDDGNLTPGDGCNELCQIEGTPPPPPSVPRCGDGFIDASEECDDRNNVSFDGCSAECFLEIGFCGDGVIERALGEQCEPILHDPALPFTCSDACRHVSLFCGNGELDLGEECDDGSANSESPDARCRLDCSFGRCGDGILDSPEQCDDGNRLRGDGCDNFCLEELIDPNVAFGVPGGSPGLQTSNTVFNPPNVDSAQGTPGRSRQEEVRRSDLYSLNSTANALGGVQTTTATGPATILFMAAGAAAGIGWIRRRR